MKLIKSVMGRRQFLAAGAASTSVVALKNVAGIFNPAFQTVDATASEKSGSVSTKGDSDKKYIKTIKADVVVLGSGAGGMTAAIRAKQQGAENVIILEKRSEIGGNSVFAPIPIRDDLGNNKETRSEQLFMESNESTHWGGDALIIGSLIDVSEDVSDWLKEFAGGVRGGVRDGMLVKILKAQCDKLGISIICNTRGIKVLQDKDKKIYGQDEDWTCGVLAEQNGEVIKVDAKITILATGGFLGDPEFMEKYFPYYDDKFFDEVNMEGLAYSGDGIKMAIEAGAANDGTVSFQWSMNKVPFFKGDLNEFPTISFLTDNTKTPEALWVNNVGMRFTNESKSHAANALYRQPNKDCFIILDAGIVEHMAKKHPDRVSLEKLQKEITPLIEANQALVVDSVAAVAAWSRAKLHIIQFQFNNYNSSCEKGYDELFYKDPAFLVPFSKPPFYVFRSGLSLMSTLGPLRVTGSMCVNHPGGWPIPNLYACGADIGGLHTDRFINGEESHSIGWTIASGLIAGERAAGFVLTGSGRAQLPEMPKYTAKEIMAGNFENVGAVVIEPGGPSAEPSQPEGRKIYH